MDETPERPRPRRLVTTLLPALIALAFLGIGAGAGFYATSLPLRRSYDKTQGPTSVADMIDRDAFNGTAAAYLDVRAAHAHLRDYLWMPPQVPTPLVGAAPLPGVHLNAHINRQQLRADHDVAMPKPAGMLRVFLVGGSAAFSVGAPSEDRTIHAYLRGGLARRLGRAPETVEVFAAANPGWATVQEALFISHRIIEWEPDLVLALSGNNDPSWGFLGYESSWFRNWPEEYFFELLSLSQTLGGRAKLPNLVTPVPDRPAADKIAATLGRNVRTAADDLADLGVPYGFALQPHLGHTRKALSGWEQFRYQEIPDYLEYTGAAYDAIDATLRAFHRPNFGYRDLRGVFDAVDRQIFYDSCHYGDAGNEIVAAALADFAVELLAGPRAAPAE